MIAMIDDHIFDISTLLFLFEFDDVLVSKLKMSCVDTGPQQQTLKYNETSEQLDMH
jgi:hypothetical protein